MQPNNQQQFYRSRKYDTYVSGDSSAKQNILPQTPVQAPTSTAYQPTYSNIPVHTQPQHQPSLSQTAPVTQYENPITKPVLSKYTFTAPPKKQKASQTALSTIMNATVKLEKVTRNSMHVVKQTFEPPELDAWRSKKQKILARTFYAVGAASFIVMVGFAGAQLFSKPNQKNASEVLGAQTNQSKKVGGDISEQKPTEQDIKTYLVAPEYPRYIRIPKIGLESRVRRLGIDSKGAIGYPNNIYDIGWYDGSVKPGEQDGSSVLVGHIMGQVQQGALWSVDTITAGDVIEIEKGNGSTIRYKVTKTQKAQPEDDLSDYLTPDIKGKHDLKLITVTGMYERVGGNNDQRIVVYAQQI